MMMLHKQLHKMQTYSFGTSTDLHPTSMQALYHLHTDGSTMCRLSQTCMALANHVLDTMYEDDLHQYEWSSLQHGDMHVAARCAEQKPDTHLPACLDRLEGGVGCIALSFNLMVPCACKHGHLHQHSQSDQSQANTQASYATTRKDVPRAAAGADGMCTCIDGHVITACHQHQRDIR